MLTLTDNAVEHLKALVNQHGEPGQGLRIFVEKGGCAGMQYGMKLDAPANEDQRVERDGAFVVVDPESLGYLDGCVIDFSDTLNDSGFKIQNPNAVRNCGCGTSFETANSPAADPNASCE